MAYESKFKKKDIDELFEAILLLEDEEDCYRFFEDICTIKELQDLSQRLETAIMLRKGINYQNISKQVGVSSATISRVNRCLQYGKGGYESAIKKLSREE